MLLSDNGATGEGGPLGTRSPVPGENGAPDTTEAKLEALADWGGPSTSPCYAQGWAMAGNAPNRWYKQFAHEGGTRAPLIVHWPAGTAEPARLRPQFHHVVDVAATILDVAGALVAGRGGRLPPATTRRGELCVHVRVSGRTDA